MIEEIVVTARKREESLQETPVVVNVLTEEMISAGQIEGIKDLGTIVPGLVTTESVSSTQGLIFLRGVGSGSLTPLIDQAVSINVDGVGISSAALLNASMFDLDRIEVLRGPQALIWVGNITQPPARRWAETPVLPGPTMPVGNQISSSSLTAVSSSYLA